jgi:hypothetical protein
MKKFLSESNKPFKNKIKMSSIVKDTIIQIPAGFAIGAGVDALLPDEEIYDGNAIKYIGQTALALGGVALTSGSLFEYLAKNGNSRMELIRFIPFIITVGAGSPKLTHRITSISSYLANKFRNVYNPQPIDPIVHTANTGTSALTSVNTHPAEPLKIVNNVSWLKN